MQTELASSTSPIAQATGASGSELQQQLQTSCMPQQAPNPMQAVPECSGCLCQIQDRYYLLVMDRMWHLSCLRCCDCKQSLDTQQSCFSKDGLIYCKDDYFK